MTIRQAARPLPGQVAHLEIPVPFTGGLLRLPFVSKYQAGPQELSHSDQMLSGPFSHWHHTHRFEPLSPTTSALIDQIEWRPLPGMPEGPLKRMIDATFAARHRRIARDLAEGAALDAQFPRRLRILIAGASGLIGTQVAALLGSLGHEIRLLVRRAPRAGQSQWDPQRGQLNPADVAWADAVIHLGGVSVGQRFTTISRHAIRYSRVASTQVIADTIAGLPESDRPEVFVCASATGAYGSRRPGEDLTEDTPTGDGFLADVCRQWETRAARVADAGVRPVSMRTGVVLTSLGGILPQQLPLFLAGVGGPLGDPQAYFPWISLDDIARTYCRAVLDSSLSGPVNAVAPKAVTNREFADTLADLLRRPAAIPVPRFGPELLLGRQCAEELVFVDQKVVPTGLVQAGFAFTHPNLRVALRETLGID